MPRRRSQSRALVLGAIGVVLGFLLLWGLSVAVGRGDIDPSNLSDRDVWVGNADRLADRIEKDGPFILADLSPDKDRVVFLQHVGDEDDRGWSTVLAGTSSCPVRWTGTAFVDCHGSSEHLTRYKTWVEKNGVYVDLRSER
jgi:hypothetical protein